jgi:POT family proton-dependent oligopeptide transporter
MLMTQIIAAIIIIGFGTGGIKSNIAPLIADQYQRRKMAIKVQKSGERTIIDPAITYQRIYMVFYWCINLGSLSLIATPFMEKAKGYEAEPCKSIEPLRQYADLTPLLCRFWTAFLMCFCAFNLGILVLILRRKSYVVRPPQGQIITDAFKAIGIMIKSRNLNAPKPTWRAANGVAKPVPWNDHFIDELQRALKACKVFIFCKHFYCVVVGNFH